MKYRNVFEKHTCVLEPIPTQVETVHQVDGIIKCVLFDIYGTLVISESGGVGTLAQKTGKIPELQLLLNKFGFKMHADELLAAFTEAIKRKHQELKKFDIDYPEIRQEQIWMEVLNINELEIAKDFAIEFEMIVNAVYPMPHAKQILTTLKKIGVYLGIISNAQFYTNYLLRWFFDNDIIGLGFHPELIFYSFQYGHAKPSLYLFQLAGKKIAAMGLSNNETLYVGNDMLNDIYPAKQLGFKTCLFAGDARSLRLRAEHPSCLNLKPDLVISDLSQIIDILTGAHHVTTRSGI